MTATHLKFTEEALGHLIADRFLDVPPYQRPYAWEEEQVSQFWTDLAAALKDQREYFIGAVVLTPIEGGHHHVIDGQQRLVTTALLFAALRDELISLGANDLAAHIEQRFLQSFDRSTGAIVPKVAIPSADRDFFISRFLQRAGGQPTSVSQRLMLTAFTVLRRAVSDAERHESQSARISALSRWLDHLDQSVLTVVVDAATDADAFQIFETLNDRGVPLTIADLLKNYLMSLDSGNTDYIADAWNTALAGLGTEVETQDFVTFIRHFWNSTAGATRERDLYRSLRQHIVTAPDATAFVTNLAQAAEPYAAGLDATHPFWSDNEEPAPRAIETLLLFQLGQYRPLLLAAMQMMRTRDIAILLESLVSWSFRGIIVGGIGGGTMERAYAQAAMNVRSGLLGDPWKVYTQLRPQIPGDDDFRSAFETASIPRVRIANYVMRALNRAMEGDEHPALEPYPGNRSFPVSAHILPRQANPLTWRGFAADDIERNVFRIGNLILRPPGRTTSAPLIWEDRVNWAVALGYPVNTFGVQTEQWNSESIRHRQQDMAALAVDIWPREPR